MGGFVKDFCSLTSYAKIADNTTDDNTAHPRGVFGRDSLKEELRRTKECDSRFEKRLECFPSGPYFCTLSLLFLMALSDNGNVVFPVTVVDDDDDRSSPTSLYP
mmetsp:Transcript_2861/g.6080  ORF Transcript_2861/g.6080 Transcript_2861/m.6080 type:complete len:104 (+) Transcript_2861:1370-1681(+)